MRSEHGQKKERKEEKKVQLGCEQDFLFGSLRNRFPIRVFVSLGRATLYIIFQCLKQLQKIRPPRKQISVAGSFTVKREKVAQEADKHFHQSLSWILT